MTRRSAEEWQHLIDAQQASDITIAEFCHALKINQSSFYLQRKKRNEMALPLPQRNNDWLPIDAVVPDLPDTKQWQIELRLPNGVVLNMSTDG
ncbi:MAG: IS66 family insertion sequence element accessory protein TnpB [Glaciecola sp.]|jgi:hypothetical protein